jgi:hypothetical protein
MIRFTRIESQQDLLVLEALQSRGQIPIVYKV